MKNEKLEIALNKQFNGKYFTIKELEYGYDANIFLSPVEFKEFIEYKESIASIDNKYVTKIPLPAFNFKILYYSLGVELENLLNNYIYIVKENIDLNDRFSRDFIESRIYSEIEGTLNVENVPTTRKRLKELLENDAPIKDTNDIIIKNMKAGIDFVNTLPTFNKENLFKLYSLLSENCLDDENKLHKGDFYRYDSVEISYYHGCPHNKINEYMDAFFDFVNNKLKSKNVYELILLPHICHYYMLYIHPYFDFNGRTARMVSYWIYLLSGQTSFPPIISEAINYTKSKYYEAIELTRDTHNDLTYFLIYLLNISIDYFMCYQNLKIIEQRCKNKGNELTSTELNYIKKIIISYCGTFAYSDFLKMVNISMSKQGALKILNKFIDYGVLVEVKSKSKTKLFDINRKNITYLLKNMIKK